MIDVEQLLRTLEIEVRSESGDNLKALCPQHKERTGKIDSHPSWSIHRETGDHYCFSCQYGGGVRTLVRDVLGMESATEAWRWLVSHNLTDLTVSDYQEAVHRRNGERRQTKVPTTVTEAHLRLFDPEIPAKQLKKRRLKQRSCEHYGVRWDTKRKAWMLPIRLPEGELLGYQLKPLEGHPLNVPTTMVKSSTLFGAAEHPGEGEPAILVESPLDVVRLHSVGVVGGMATMGTAVSDVQMDIVMELTDRVVLAFDRDAAGKATTERLAEDYRRRLKLTRFSYRPALEAYREGWYENPPKDIGDMAKADILDGLENTRPLVRL